MRTLLSSLAVLLLAVGCAPHRAASTHATLVASTSASCCAAQPQAGCKCHDDANGTCSCAFTGGECSDGAKSCKDTACKAGDCTCRNTVCPAMEHSKSPGECDGNDHVSGGADHCKKK